MGKIKVLILTFAVLLPALGFSSPPPNFKVTNEMIYRKLTEMEKRQAVFEERFKQINKRFEDMNKRFEDLREDMNKRFEDINKRFEDMNKRFEDLREDMNRRFDQLTNFLWIITGIFTAIMGVTIGFAYWDRKTMIREARREVFEDMEREIRPEKFRKVLRVLREIAEVNEEVREILKREGLL